MARLAKKARRSSIRAIVHACLARSEKVMLLPSNQVLVERVDVLVRRDDAGDAMAVERDAPERARELLAVAGHHQQTEAIVVQPDLRDVFLAEQAGRDVG